MDNFNARTPESESERIRKLRAEVERCRVLRAELEIAMGALGVSPPRAQQSPDENPQTLSD